MDDKRRSITRGDAFMRGSPRGNSGTFAPVINGAVFSGLGVGNLYLLAMAFNQSFDDVYRMLTVLVAVILFVFFQRFSLVWRWKVGHVGSIGTRMLMHWVLVVAALMLSAIMTRQTEHFSRGALLGWFVTTPVLFILAHVLVRHFVLRYCSRILPARSAVIAFVSPWSNQLAAAFDQMDTPQFNLLGYFEDRPLERTGDRHGDLPILGPVSAINEYVNTHRVDAVFVVLPLRGADRALNVVEGLGDTTASVYYVPDSRFFDPTHLRFSEIGGMPILTFTDSPFYGADGLFKRLGDMVLASVMLLCMAPVFLLVATAILIKMGRPIIFTQQRYGLDGRSIGVHKFRTMRVQENGAVIKQVTRDDARVTPLGRFLRRTSVDEWPQLWNVIKGEMSLVGPRPHAVTHNEEYRKLVQSYMVRHKVKPGLTGWAQVKGLRGETRSLDDMRMRVHYDLEYIRRWSPGLDILIMLMTLWIVFRDHEAY